MKVETLYTCELCGYASTVKEDVERCEASGFPPSNHIQPGFDFNKDVALYGRHGKVIARVMDVFIDMRGLPATHEWTLRLDGGYLVGDCDWENNGSNGYCGDHYLDPENLDYIPRKDE